MRTDRRAESRRGLVAVLVILAVLALTVDLLRSDSFIRGAFQDATDARSTPLERMLDQVLP